MHAAPFSRVNAGNPSVSAVQTIFACLDLQSRDLRYSRSPGDRIVEERAILIHFHVCDVVLDTSTLRSNNESHLGRLAGINGLSKA